MASLTTGCVDMKRTNIQFIEHITGLDPVFRSSLKLHVRDIEALLTADAGSFNSAETERKAELFCYKTHVVNRVEVMGIVVRVDKRERRHSYAVDDGTGVITCTCWKNSGSGLPEITTEDLPVSLQQKYRQLQSYYQSRYEHGYTIGDLVLMKGRIVTFRNQREIDVLDHRRIDNPTTELDRVLELPSLHSIYDNPFIPPKTVSEDLIRDAHNSFNESAVQDAISKHIQDPSLMQCVFSAHDVLSWPSIKAILPVSEEPDPESSAKCRSVVKSVLRFMEACKGTVCRRSDLQDIYETVRADCPLAAQVLVRLCMACENGKAAETGCHVLHLQSLLKECPEYASLQPSVLSYLLNCLETNSDVIDLGQQRYLPVS